MRIFWLVSLVGCFFLSSCSENGDPQKEGAKTTAAIAETLRACKNRDDLLEAVGALEVLFLKLADAMVEAERRGMPPGENPHARDLEEELRRVYLLDGGREIVEAAQKKSLERLQKRFT